MVKQNKKLIYSFEEGNAGMRNLMGGKGANLAEMAGLELPVPPGFTITTEACLLFYEIDNHFPDGLWLGIKSYMKWLNGEIGREFGSPTNPLLVSVRSGARVSMPGMMDTILNLGINDDIVGGLAKMMNNKRAAYDTYRRFLQMFATVVMDVDSSVFEELLGRHKANAKVEMDYELSYEQLVAIIDDFKSAIYSNSGRSIPEDPWDQLYEAIRAVFLSWNSPRAIRYRDHYNYSHDWGTAVNILAMVFGNLGNDSGTGVIFTRNPTDGHKELYGEYLTNGQGEDVVAGIRNPEPISSLLAKHPSVYNQLAGMAQLLETNYRDVQDMEFTVEEGKLFLLQTRSAQRTVQSAVKIAVDMVNEGMITEEEAINRVKADELSLLFVPRFYEGALEDARKKNDFLAKGLAASPGAASGQAYFDATRAAEAGKLGIDVVLVRPETKPDDIHGMLESKGVLTSRGGVTSHAAVVTRGLGIPCIAGCEAIQVDEESRLFMIDGRTIEEGTNISIDGTTGEVFAGKLPTHQPDLEELHDAQILLSWADKRRRLEVWANADTPVDAERAVAMGAEGIGLCRTEHMFLGPDRVPVVQKMLLNAQEATRWSRANHSDTRNRTLNGDIPNEIRDFFDALDYLKELQIQDFTGILRAMTYRPVIVRLLDAPLHEFLPNPDTLARDVMSLKKQKAPQSQIEERQEFLRLVESMRETNPMLGHRGCRVGITFPAIYEMQVEALITAAAHLIKEGIEVRPEIMIPITSHVNELRVLKDLLSSVADKVQEALGTKVPYLFGTMIEVPRAALTAGQLSEVAEFFSFGTNDLTQMTFAFSRDDAEGKFLTHYLEDEILPISPFVTLDIDGVGSLIRTAVEQGRAKRPDLSVGICGEHGGDPASVTFCHREGLDYVSCSPFRVPLARLAAAQAALE